MTHDHLTPDRVTQIVEENRIDLHELTHVEICATCNDWLRAFAALASNKGHKVTLEVPPEPSWLENFRTWCSTIRT